MSPESILRFENIIKKIEGNNPFRKTRRRTKRNDKTYSSQDFSLILPIFVARNNTRKFEGRIPLQFTGRRGVHFDVYNCKYFLRRLANITENWNGFVNVIKVNTNEISYQYDNDKILRINTDPYFKKCSITKAEVLFAVLEKKLAKTIEENDFISYLNDFTPRDDIINLPFVRLSPQASKRYFQRKYQKTFSKNFLPNLKVLWFLPNLNKSLRSRMNINGKIKPFENANITNKLGKNIFFLLHEERGKIFNLNRKNIKTRRKPKFPFAYKGKYNNFFENCSKKSEIRRKHQFPKYFTLNRQLRKALCHETFPKTIEINYLHFKSEPTKHNSPEGKLKLGNKATKPLLESFRKLSKRSPKDSPNDGCTSLSFPLESKNRNKIHVLERDFVVFVKDINDNIPKFSQETFHMGIIENGKSGESQLNL